MNYINLFINDPVNAELDMNQELDIALQYSIADIKDISKRNAAYSKTIVLPGTKNNNYWFGNIFDVNSDFTMFNPNKKTPAKLIVNTETVIDGFLQLRKITKLNNSDHQGNLINYECVIFNNAIDLMSFIGEKTLNEIDLSEFGHTFSAANIKASWTHTWEDGYVYPMFGTEAKDNQYKPEYFYPAIFYRKVLDQIVREAGFGWTGSLASNTQFNHEVISYVTDGRPKISEEEREKRLYYVGLTTSQTLNVLLGDYPNSFNSYPVPFGGVNSGAYGGGWTVSFGVESGSAPAANSAGFGGGTFFDNNNNWNQTLYYWDIQNPGRYDLKYNFSYNVQIRNPHPTTDVAFAVGTVDVRFKIYHQVQYKTLSSSSWVNWDTVTQDVVYTQSTINAGASASKYVNVSRQVQTQLELPAGTKVRLLWRGQTINSPNAGVGWWGGTGGNATPALKLYLSFLATNGGNWIKNEAEITEFQQNDYIQLGRYLPDKVKQKDLIQDLIRRYNLYIQTDPNNPRVLIFDDRPSYYKRGTTLDWTDKKDYSQTDSIELLSDLQSKLMIWSYKSDTDTYNKLYTEVTGDTYGQYKYYFDNDFVKGESKIESQFSPTPIIKTPFNALVAGIDPEQPKVQPRIFYWGGLRGCDTWQWTYTDAITGATGNTETFTTYPYAGHFDDPVDPTIDINFGQNKYYYYDDWNFITQNNMYNTYWSDYVRQIESGRLITSYFYLDEYDIRFIRDNFYTKVFVLDSYYYVNKIIDYKPLQNGVTKVELIKVVEGLKWEPKKSTKKPLLRPRRIYNKFDSIGIGFNNNIGSTGLVVGSNNITGGVWIRGSQSGSFKSMTIGDYNVNSADNTLILGDYNKIESDKSFILGGDYNEITKDAYNTYLIGTSYLTATQSNQVYLGNNFVIDINTGSFSSPYFSSASASLSTLSGGITNSLTKWSSSTGLTNSNVTDEGGQVTIGGTTASISSAFVLNNTNGGNQFWNLGIASGGSGQVGRMSPNKFNGINNLTNAIIINPASGYTLYLMSGTGSNRYVELPSINFLEYYYVIMEAAGVASTKPLEIRAAAGETINGTSSIWITDDYGAIQIYSDGKSWRVMSNTSTAMIGTSSSAGSIGATGATGPAGATGPSGAGYVYYTENTTNKIANVIATGSGSTSSYVYSTWDANQFKSLHGVFGQASYDQTELEFLETSARLRVYNYAGGASNTEVSQVYLRNINDEGVTQIRTIGVTYSNFININPATPSDTYFQHINNATGEFTKLDFSDKSISISLTNSTVANFGATISIGKRIYFEKGVNHYPIVATVSGTYSLDYSAANVWNLTLNGNTTLDFTNSYEGSYIVRIKQDGSGGRTLGLASGGKFLSNTSLTIATASNAISLIQLIHIGTQSVVQSVKNLTTI